MPLLRFMSAFLVRYLIMVITVFLLSGCPSPTVTPDLEDQTPPIVKMDAYGVPSDGTYTPPPYTDVDANCCDITRPVPLGTKIDLIASGNDPESGMLQLNISAFTLLTCRATDPSSNEFYHDQRLVKLGETEDQTPGGQPTPTTLIAQGSIRLKDFEGFCRPGFRVEIYQAEILATAVNTTGRYSRTKKLELINNP